MASSFGTINMQDIAPQTGQGEKWLILFLQEGLQTYLSAGDNEGRSQVMILIEMGLKTEPFCNNSEEKFKR
eukprot:758182-Hanusia_phi.AAC.1